MFSLIITLKIPSYCKYTWDKFLFSVALFAGCIAKRSDNKKRLRDLPPASNEK